MKQRRPLTPLLKVLSITWIAVGLWIGPYWLTHGNVLLGIIGVIFAIGGFCLWRGLPFGRNLLLAYFVIALLLGILLFAIGRARPALIVQFILAAFFTYVLYKWKPYIEDINEQTVHAEQLVQPDASSGPR